MFRINSLGCFSENLQCGQSITFHDYKISSPEFPSYYPPNSDCYRTSTAYANKVLLKPG